MSVTEYEAVVALEAPVRCAKTADPAAAAAATALSVEGHAAPAAPVASTNASLSLVERPVPVTNTSVPVRDSATPAEEKENPGVVLAGTAVSHVPVLVQVVLLAQHLDSSLLPLPDLLFLS